MIEGRGAGKRFLGKGTPRARPSICPTQVPPDLGNSLITYSLKGPDKRCTIPPLTRALVSSRVLKRRLMPFVPRHALSPLALFSERSLRLRVKFKLFRNGSLRGWFSESGAVNGLDPPHHGCVAKLGSPPLASRFAQAAGASWIAQEADERVTESGRVSRRDQKSLPFVSNLVGDPAHAAGDNGDAGRHGLEYNQRCALAERGDY